MARNALNPKKFDPKFQANQQARVKRQAASSAFASKTFEQLSQKEKDALLKELAVRAGLLQDS